MIFIRLEDVTYTNFRNQSQLRHLCRKLLPKKGSLFHSSIETS